MKQLNLTNFLPAFHSICYAKILKKIVKSLMFKIKKNLFYTTLSAPWIWRVFLAGLRFYGGLWRPIFGLQIFFVVLHVFSLHLVYWLNRHFLITKNKNFSSDKFHWGTHCLYGKNYFGVEFTIRTTDWVSWALLSVWLRIRAGTTLRIHELEGGGRGIRGLQ